MKHSAIVQAALLALALALAGGAAGCARTHQGRSVEPSGFLGDYSQLQPGKKGEVKLVYIKPGADFRGYNKLLLEPVVIYASEDSKLRKLKPEDLQKLVDYFDAALREKLAANFAFVTAPGPGVLRMRVALTDAKGSAVALDTVSSIIPIGIALSGIQSMAFGRGSGIGETSVEFEALDSQSGERLAAGVDKRVGNKYTLRLDKFSKWRATKASCDYWAERLHARAVELQAGPPAAPAGQ